MLEEHLTKNMLNRLKMFPYFLQVLLMVSTWLSQAISGILAPAQGFPCVGDVAIYVKYQLISIMKSIHIGIHIYH